MNASGRMAIYSSGKRAFAYTYSGQSSFAGSLDGDWELVLKTSGTLTFQAAPDTVDIFLCGGGGGGAHWSENWDSGVGFYWGGGGGGGGYRNTASGVTVNPGTAYSIAIAGGGSPSPTSGVGNGAVGGTAGGTSSGLGYSAAGGACPKNPFWTTGPGGAGGSSGGHGGGGTGAPASAGADGAYAFGSSTLSLPSFGAGYMFGGGGAGGGGYRTDGTAEYSGKSGGKSGGGASRGYGAGSGVAGSGVANSGGGGAGTSVYAGSAGSGGSGVVIIRNHR